MLVEPPPPDAFTLSLFGPLLVLPTYDTVDFCVLPIMDADCGLPKRL